jgi:hypothetical protein
VDYPAVILEDDARYYRCRRKIVLAADDTSDRFWDVLAP